ncbi:hypothetical protein P9112_000389 [Eukaryota sp. TZLM1-RC]
MHRPLKDQKHPKLSPTYLRTQTSLIHSTTAYLNFRKHSIHSKLNPCYSDLPSPTYAQFFIHYFDLPFLYKDAPAPFVHDANIPLDVGSRNLKINDLIHCADWNSRIYFHHGKMPYLVYVPDAMPLNAHLVILNHFHPDITLGTIIDSVCIFHLIPLFTHMAAFSFDRNWHLLTRLHRMINSPTIVEGPHMYLNSHWYRAEQARYHFHGLVPPHVTPKSVPTPPIPAEPPHRSTSAYLVKPCHSSLPPAVLDVYTAADAG